MAHGKSTWKYNKLLTPRRNYFLLGSKMNNGPLTEGELLGYLGNYQSAQPTIPWSRVGIPELYNHRPLTQEIKSPEPPKKEVDDGKGTFPTGAIGGIAGAAAYDIGNMINKINANDVAERRKQYMANVNSSQLGNVKNDSFDQLLNDYSQVSNISNVTAKDLGASSVGSVIGNSVIGGLRGSAAGFGLGSSFAYGGPFRANKYMGGGPIGAIIGGVMGTATSLIGDLVRNHKAEKAAQAINNNIAYTNAFNQRALDNRALNLVNNQMMNLNANYSAEGGPLYGQHGGYFSDGLQYIGNGGTHETNPYEGVPIGLDPEGTPNLVEEGEAIFNDFVFSNRLKVPRGLRRKYKLGGVKPLTFAKAAVKLNKEAEERPNDPISINGIHALFADLANTQEELKKASEKEGEQYAFGGNLFETGGDTKWTHDNTKNDDAMAGHELFEPFFKDGQFNFDAMYADGSTYRQKLDVVAGILYKRKQDPNYKYTDNEKRILQGYLDNVKAWNNGKGYGSIDELSYDKIINKSLTTTDGVTFTYNTNAKKKERGLAMDFLRGGHHFGAAGVDPYEEVEEHKIKTKEGLKDLEKEKWYWEDIDDDGNKWTDTVGKEYRRLHNGQYKEIIDEKNKKRIKRYFYEPIEPTPDPVTKYMIKRKGAKEYEEVTGDNPLLKIKNEGKFYQSDKNIDKNVTTLYYDEEPDFGLKGSAKWLRYSPAVALGLASIADIAGLTNEPDYTDANALLEASSKPGQYQPVAFNPIGNYLKYNPFDRDYYINKQNAEAGAARRAIMNNSAGNRGTALASILAGDLNYLNSIGTLAREGEEFNFNQRKEVEDFNRTTNTTNSQGKLQADMANQNALASLRDYQLKGLADAARLKQEARIAADNAKSANVSGFFQTLGDIGWEEANRDMTSWAILHGAAGPGTDDYTWSRVRRKAKGGKVKRKKKGLTY